MGSNILEARVKCISFYLAFYTVKLESLLLTAGQSESGVKYKLKDEKIFF